MVLFIMLYKGVLVKALWSSCGSSGALDVPTISGFNFRESVNKTVV